MSRSPQLIHAAAYASFNVWHSGQCTVWESAKEWPCGGRAAGPAAVPPSASTAAGQRPAEQPASRRRDLHCDGTYVGSPELLSITDPYPATRPLPPITRTARRAVVAAERRAHDVVERAHFVGGERDRRALRRCRPLRREHERGVLRRRRGVVHAHVGAPAIAAAGIERRNARHGVAPRSCRADRQR